MVHNRNSTNRHNSNKMDHIQTVGDKCNLFCNTGSTVCMHVWSKFDLLPPTPPRSPVHDVSVPGIEDIELYSDMEFFLREEDVLATMKTLFPEEPPPSPKLQADPMWSGSMGPREVAENKAKSQSCENLVNPVEVFPYPLTANYMTETRVHILGTETPSDSEEEIDVVTVSKDQKAKTEEKIEFNPSEIRRSSTTVPVRIDSDRDTHTTKLPIKSTITIKREHSAHDDHHNYCVVNSNSHKRGRSSIDSPTPYKRHKSHQVSGPELHRALTQVTPKMTNSGLCSSTSSSQNSSDSEEYCGEGKRNQHNVLERKRRNDLKYSFFHLRDIVPDLCQQERAPKVLILKKSSDYIRRLIAESQSLEKEKERLSARREQLSRTLSKQQNSAFF